MDTAISLRNSAAWGKPDAIGGYQRFEVQRPFRQSLPTDGMAIPRMNSNAGSLSLVSPCHPWGVVFLTNPITRTSLDFLASSKMSRRLFVGGKHALGVRLSPWGPSTEFELPLVVE